ncbi:MAG: glycoside hydrolase family 9 protein [Ruminococcus sp.]|nr:glycoside hydrolase family 9 protein [Ruminococcus sp.]
MKFKKSIAAICAAAITMTSTVSSNLFSTIATAEPSESSYNYAEALQKSMFFYEVQQCGELPEWNQVSWRGDCMENDYVPGGWFDAGDHIKFALTNAYTATVMAWGVYQYKDAVKKAGLYETYLNNLQWGLDYVAGCDKGDKVIGTIADDAFDHVWWGSAEVYMRKFVLKGGSDPRPYDEITCTSTVAQMAAAMASGYLVFKDEKPELAKSYLEHAESLFKLADSTRSNEGNQGVQGGGNYYKASDFYDDLFYAANWMYMATGEQKYLDLCESDYIPQFATESQSTERKYTWGFCWDDASQAASLLYAINTGKDEWKQQVKKHLEYWTTGYGGKQVQYTPDGLAWLFQWGSLRHATTTAWLALLACDTIFVDDANLCDKYNTWAKSQMDYCFGDNNLGMSYVLGMGEKNPNSFHHRTASGIYNDHWNELGKVDENGNPVKDPQWQTEYAHTLYGALEGGPNQDGTFTDRVESYQNTEVAIDYNAGFTAALCAMIDNYGGEPLADFPPQEEPKWAEFLVKASINQQAGSFTEIKAYAMNHSAWPARVIKDLSYNYYFDISELIDAGYSIDDVKVQKGTDQHSGDEGVATVSDPIHYKDNIYYVKITFGDGRVVMPTGQSEHRSELQFRIGIADTIQNVWDASNDYSFKDLVQGGEDAMIETPYITMYDGDTLIWGEEPDGTKPVVTTTTTEATTTTTTTTTTTVTTEITTNPDEKIPYGDVNGDNKINLSDVIYLNKYIAGSYMPSNSGIVNANCDLTNNDVDLDDTLALLKYLIKLVDLPIV